MTRIQCPVCGYEQSAESDRKKIYCYCCGRAILTEGTGPVLKTPDPFPETNIDLTPHEPRVRGLLDFSASSAAGTHKELKELRRKRKSLPANIYNEKIFHLFYKDLEEDTLPAVRKSLIADLAWSIAARSSIAAVCIPDRASPASAETTLELTRRNQEIPREITIWVNKVFACYFSDLKPMLGLASRCEGAKMRLYAYRGYRYYTLMERYPDAIIE